jgi:hypothetical protein
MQPRWHEPATTPQGELLTLVKQLEKELENPKLADRDKDGKLSGWEKAVGKKIEASKKGKQTGDYKSDRGDRKIPFKEVKKAGMCKNSMCKNTECMGGCETGMKKGDAPVSSSTAGTSKPRHTIKPDPDDEHNEKVFADIMGDGDRDKAQRNYDKKVNKADLTAQIIMKYQQEKSNFNLSPQFIDYSGGTPVEAKPYQTNGTIPFYTEKAPASNPISEKAKLFAVAKTGYDVDGSTMHMNIVDGGDTGGPYNLAPIEDSMATLHKMGGDSGLLNEIAFLIEKIGNHQ